MGGTTLKTGYRIGTVIQAFSTVSVVLSILVSESEHLIVSQTLGQEITAWPSSYCLCLFDEIEDVLFEGLVDLGWTFVVPQTYGVDVSVGNEQETQCYPHLSVTNP